MDHEPHASAFSTLSALTRYDTSIVHEYIEEIKLSARVTDITYYACHEALIEASIEARVDPRSILENCAGISILYLEYAHVCTYIHTY